MGPIQVFVTFYLEQVGDGTAESIAREHAKYVARYGFTPFTVKQVRRAARRMVKREMIQSERIDGCEVFRHLMSDEIGAPPKPTI